MTTGRARQPEGPCPEVEDVGRQIPPVDVPIRPWADPAVRCRDTLPRSAQAVGLDATGMVITPARHDGPPDRSHRIARAVQTGPGVAALPDGASGGDEGTGRETRRPPSSDHPVQQPCHLVFLGDRDDGRPSPRGSHQNLRSAGAIFLRLMPPSASVVSGSTFTGR